MKRLLIKLRLKKPAYQPAHPSSWSFKEMEDLLNTTALFLVEQYGRHLVGRSPTYLVPVIWGEEEDGSLNSVQKKMNGALAPVLEELLQGFSSKRRDSGGPSSVEYLVKGLVLYKMAYMVQYYLNCKGPGEITPGEWGKDLLQDIEPAGRA